MTLPMLETLRTESARVHLELFRRGSEADEERLPISRNGGTYYPVPYEFVYLRMRIANHSRELNLPLPYSITFELTRRSMQRAYSPVSGLDCGHRSRPGRSRDTRGCDVGHTDWAPRARRGT
jgi:hypothetical protein